MLLLSAASPGLDVSICSSESRLRRKSLFTVTFLSKYWCCLRCKSRFTAQKRGGKRPGWTLIRLAGSKVHSGAAISGLAQPALSDPTPLISQLHPQHTLSHPPILQLCPHFDTTLFFCDAQKHPQHTHTNMYVRRVTSLKQTNSIFLIF